MKTARLTRISAHPDHGVFGSLTLEGRPICNTLEPYHRTNERNMSCIPAGVYLVVPHDSPKYGSCYLVTNVQERSGILIHWGNVDDHTEGCILVGEEFGLLGDEWAVLSSRKAFGEFMKVSSGRKLLLTIVEAY